MPRISTVNPSDSACLERRPRIAEASVTEPSSRYSRTISRRVTNGSSPGIAPVVYPTAQPASSVLAEVDWGDDERPNRETEASRPSLAQRDAHRRPKPVRHAAELFLFAHCDSGRRTSAGSRRPVLAASRSGIACETPSPERERPGALLTRGPSRSPLASGHGELTSTHSARSMPGCSAEPTTVWSTRPATVAADRLIPKRPMTGHGRGGVSLRSPAPPWPATCRGQSLARGPAQRREHRRARRGHWPSAPGSRCVRRRATAAAGWHPFRGV